MHEFKLEALQVSTRRKTTDSMIKDPKRHPYYFSIHATQVKVWHQLIKNTLPRFGGILDTLL